MSFKSKKKPKPQAMPTLDLHGLKKDEVFDALDSFMVKNQSKTRVRVMTGKGKGIVAAEAKRYLKAGNYPFVVEKLENGKPNDGVLIVILD